jgi:hypothetical protein
MVDEFKIRHSWLRSKDETAIGATIGKLNITVHGQTVTENDAEKGERFDFIEVPGYYLAEWLAENWWPLLWEPRKNEEIGDDPDFLSRHSFLTAQNGFALPKISIVPFGKNVDVSARARYVQFADIRFKKSASVSLPRVSVESEIRKFVEAVVTRLSEKNISKTILQDMWSLVLDTSEDEKQFCELMGALGLSPYVGHNHAEAALEAAMGELGPRFLMDLCLVSTPENLRAATVMAKAAHREAPNVQVSTLEPLNAIQPPPDADSLPAWRRGTQAAKRARDKLGIDERDPNGANFFFEMLHVSSARSNVQPNAGLGTSIVGAVEREDQEARIVLIQESETQRRFAAARGTYAAWCAMSPKESRLLTSAVTRDQQASRAFAAEMTAPLAYIRKVIRGRRLSSNHVFDIASDLNIGPDVVWKQALNNGLDISPR